MSSEPNPLCSGTFTPEVDEPARKRTQECQNGYTTAQAKIERQEQIKEAGRPEHIWNGAGAGFQESESLTCNQNGGVPVEQVTNV